MFKNYLIPILVSVFIITIALIPSHLSDAQTSKTSAPTLTIGATSPATINIGTDPMKITVTWSDTSGTKWEVRKDGVLAQTVTSRTATFNSLEKNVSHCFTVKRILPSPGLLESDKKCSAVQSAISSLTQTGLTQVKIAWTQTAATDPSQSLTSASNFKVERVLSPGQTKQVCSTGSTACSSTFIQMTPLTAVSHTDNTVVAGSEYCYEIQATWPSPRSHSMDSDRMCIKLDNTPPVISYTVTPSSLPTGSNGWYTDNPKVTWTVTENESPTTVIKTGCVDTTFDSDTPTGGTTLTCSATSVGGASATTSVTIKRDATKPVITLQGANPLYLRDDGVAFTDPGAIITDATSGPDLVYGIIATNNVDTSTAEVYSRVYNGKDLAGNDAVAVTGIVDVVHINLDTTKNAYSIGDNVYVTVVDYLAWRDNSIQFVSTDFRSLYPNGITTRELISPLIINRTQGEGVFTNINPVTLVLNDDCLAELTCQEPLLTVAVDDDVKATYITFDTAKASIAENVGGFLGAPPKTTDTVRFAESDRYQLGGSATVKVNNASANTVTTTKQTVTVKILSSDDSTGFSLTLTEDGVNSGTFTGATAVSFTTGSTVKPAIKTHVDGTVTATYPVGGANVATLTIVANDNVAFTTGTAVDTSRRDSCSTDQDGDGICDDWETDTGLIIPTTVSGVDYIIPCIDGNTLAEDPTGMTVCPQTDQKDVYLEIDYMLGHVPNNNALNDVKDALANAPISGLPGGAINGIILHRFLDESTPHQKLMPYTATGSTTSFLSQKAAMFGTLAERQGANPDALLTAKRQVFHWAYFGHDQTETPNSSGLGEKPGNDFWITMGEFSGRQGTRGQQAGTLLHELGHNFGLGHGGGDETNCKGNYLSVMNYPFQFDVPDGGFVSGRPLAYSYYRFSDINENALREDIPSITSQVASTIIGGATGTGTALPAPAQLLTPTNTRIDWNRGGLLSTTTSFAQDTNYFSNLIDCQVKNGPVIISQAGNSVSATFTNVSPTGLNVGTELTALSATGASFTNGAVTITQTNTGATGTATFTDSVASTGLNLATELTGFTGAGLTSVLNTANVLKSTLTGYNDGANLVFNFRGQSTFDSGAVVVNQIHSTTSTEGIVTDEEFQTTIEVPDIYLIQSGNEGSPGFSGSGTYTDPDAADPEIGTIEGTIDWGDGTSDPLAIVLIPEVGATFRFAPHTYADDNPPGTSSDAYPIAIKITATRDDGSLNEYSYDSTIAGTFTVNNVNPTVDPILGAMINEAGTYSASGSFTDPGTDTWTATVDYDDGAGPEPLTLTGKTFSLSHQYADDKPTATPSDTHTVTVIVTDDDTGFGSGTAAVIVNNVATIVLAAGNPAPINAGSTINLASIATFTDVGVLDTHTATINWGDGSATGAGVVTEVGGSGSVAGSHLYSTAGTYTVTITVTDDDLGVGSGTLTVTVNSVVSYTVQFISGIHSGDVIKKSKNPKHLDIEWIVKDAAGNTVPPIAATVGTQYTITITPINPAGATFPGTATAFIKPDGITIDYHQLKSALTATTTYTFNVLRDGIIIGQLTNINIVP